MATYRYTNVAGKLGNLLGRLGTLGVPRKVDAQWLTGLGLSASNDRTILPVFKAMGLIETDGTPTDAWRGFRAGDKGVLAAKVKEAYADLFNTYPDANNRSNSELASFFKTHSDAGDRAIDNTVFTFRALCASADLTQANGATESGAVAVAETPVQPAVLTEGGKPLRVSASANGAITININIQLALPEKADEATYDKFFAAMKKHLLSGDPA
ncbi:MAG TPA: DUF5343 domain-containing protein [Planctomycetota bacterium]|jgi:hypothetical protein